MLKGIIFDMDGVLINTEPVHYRVWKEAFSQRGLEIDYEHYKECIGSTQDFLLDVIQKNYGADYHGDEKLLEEVRALKARKVEEEGVPLIEGVPEMLDKLKAAGYTMAVASSSPQGYIQKVLREIRLDNYFQLLYSGERVENPKPAPDIFLRVAEKLGLDPKECVVVEDSANGCRAAKAAGMVCIRYDNPDSGTQDLGIEDAVIGDYRSVDAEAMRDIYREAVSA